MLDPRIVRDDPDRIRRMLCDRAVDFDLDGLVRTDALRRDMIIKTDELRTRKNEVGRKIAGVKKAAGRGGGGDNDAAPLLAEMRDVSAELDGLELERTKIEGEYARMASAMPNLIDGSVPVGTDEAANVEVRRWGKTPRFDFEPRDHIDLAERLDLVDLVRAAKVSGARFYYLRNDLVMLNHALIRYALEFLAEKGYSAVQPPYMINRSSMEGAVIAEDFEDVIYKIDGEDLFLIGTSEHAMAAMHSDEILDGGVLPIRYAGVSPCFRKEAGAHGRDQKGIFRVHQFEKIEQFVFARPQDSAVEHARMLKAAEEFYRNLGIPHRVVLLSSADMGKVSAKTWDIEAWMAGQNAYREVVSCSNCWEYQARRLKIRFRDRTNEDTQYVHTLNGTLVATTRVLVAIMENFQTRDGHIGIPKVLRRYVAKDAI